MELIELLKKEKETINEIAKTVFSNLSLKGTVENQIWQILTRVKRKTSIDPFVVNQYQQIINDAVKNKRPISFVLISFSWKWGVQNPCKTSRMFPDRGEVEFLKVFGITDVLIKKVYPPGTQFTVLIEQENPYGRIFSTPKEYIENYQDGLTVFIEELGLAGVIKRTDFGSVLSQSINCNLPEKIRKETTKILEDKAEMECCKEQFPFVFRTIEESFPISKIGLTREEMARYYLDKTTLSLEKKLEMQEIVEKLSAEYIAVERIKRQADAVRKTFPDHLYVSITGKSSRLGLPVIWDERGGHTLFPSHGVPVYSSDGRCKIDWEERAKRYSNPIFIEGDFERKPFYWIG